MAASEAVSALADNRLCISGNGVSCSFAQHVFGYESVKLKKN